MPKLIISIDGVVLREVELTQERTTLGRRPYNDIVIDHLTISGEHALLHLNGSGAVELEDLKSTNGSHVNGQPVQRQQLANGDTLELGKYKMRFVAVSGAPAASSPAAAAAFAAAAAAAAAAKAASSPSASPSASASASTSAAAATRAASTAAAAQRVPGQGASAGATGHPPASSQPGSLGTANSMPAPLGHAVPPVSASIQVLSGNAAGRTVQLTKVVTTIGKPGVAVASITRRHHGFVLAHVEGPDKTVLNGTAIGSTPLPLSGNDVIELAGTQMRFLQAD